MTPTAHAVDMRGISKRFGGVHALRSVDFQVDAGEVHALLGGNGAGKSTILKVLNGVHAPDEGTIEVCGTRITEPSPEAARAAGMAMIFQEMSLVPSLTVAQNVFLNREMKTRLGLIDDREGERKARDLFDLLEVDVNPKALVAELGAGQRQLTEIVKAISQDARVLVLDEPSTALSVSDVDRLFVFLRKLKARGVAVIYVSHRMDEIARIADRATILRDGRHVITAPLSELPMDTMIEHIIGKRSSGFHDVKREDVEIGAPLLELVGVSGRNKPVEVTLTVHRGEIVGLAGLLGSGRSSLAKVIAGIEPCASGEIRLSGKPILARSPRDAIEAGIALVPEARATQGIIPAHSVADNLTMAVLDKLSSRGWIEREAVAITADGQIADLSIKTASRDHPVGTLSGGNQQKVVIGKWLAADPALFVLDEPTAGIDIGSKSEIIRLIRELAKAGKGVVMVSSELSELLTACDRIVVLSEGRLAGSYARKDLDDPTIAAGDTAHRLQAAEQKLQSHIQNALKDQETRHAH
ncbi:sugar ABC transporter ATP-binding protein [Acuticoccus sp. MNP-M23]|uniref:sugar ABC transporter ATP-binding protein n=1 Tax=Acuticoccus sp. MNP-M23 TaxID=3072793 RepID=UPI00281577FA|nr:sugar ABC transporter ATP-binding protein [Acuticoccus sp. MNP-M23]WMS43776.1 sugar ABC transporter ATP-binding protein [Acuticoccus sp. MNP-M23]